VKRIALSGIIAEAVMMPSAAAADHGLRAGGIAACAASLGIGPGQLAPVPQLGSYPGPPGPFGGPNSRIDYTDGTTGPI
jgi:hypothetical protein